MEPPHEKGFTLLHASTSAVVAPATRSSAVAVAPATRSSEIAPIEDTNSNSILNNALFVALNPNDVESYFLCYSSPGTNLDGLEYIWSEALDHGGVAGGGFLFRVVKLLWLCARDGSPTKTLSVGGRSLFQNHRK